MADIDPGFWTEHSDSFGGALDAHDPVMQEIDLSLALEFALNGVPDNPFVVAADNRFSWDSIGWRSFNHRHVPGPHQGEIKGSWDGGGGKSQHIHQLEEFLEFFLMGNAKPLFFIHHDQTKIFKSHIFGDEPVRSDHNIHATFGK